MRRLRYLRAGARARGAAWLRGAVSVGVFATLCSVATLGGCGPARFSSQVNAKAAGAVAAAKRAGAAEHAVYEYTAATAYLSKAREEGAYAEYQVAIDYGRRAEELATKAREIAEQKSAAAPAAVGAREPMAEPPAAARDSL